MNLDTTLDQFDKLDVESQDIINEINRQKCLFYQFQVVLTFLS